MQVMSPEQEDAAFADYAAFQGEQSSLQKIKVVFINRMKVFARSSFQWFILLVPLIYVIIQLFIAFAIIKTVVTDEGDLSTVVSIFFTFYFTFFLVLGQSLTAGLYGFIPMTEKKGGLRQMMHMSGLTSFQYYAGLFLGDIILFIGPGVVISLALIPFE